MYKKKAYEVWQKHAFKHIQMHEKNAYKNAGGCSSGGRLVAHSSEGCWFYCDFNGPHKKINSHTNKCMTKTHTNV